MCIPVYSLNFRRSLDGRPTFSGYTVRAPRRPRPNPRADTHRRKPSLQNNQEQRRSTSARSEKLWWAPGYRQASALEDGERLTDLGHSLLRCFRVENDDVGGVSDG